MTRPYVLEGPMCGYPARLAIHTAASRPEAASAEPPATSESTPVVERARDLAKQVERAVETKRALVFEDHSSNRARNASFAPSSGARTLSATLRPRRSCSAL
jgi:hypothetical protein